MASAGRARGQGPPWSGAASPATRPMILKSSLASVPVPVVSSTFTGSLSPPGGSRSCEPILPSNDHSRSSPPSARSRTGPCATRSDTFLSCTSTVAVPLAAS